MERNMVNKRAWDWTKISIEREFFITEIFYVVNDHFGQKNFHLVLINEYNIKGLELLKK